jgi:hypothetical protein
VTRTAVSSANGVAFWRDLSLAVLPTIYLLGFLAWSTHSLRLGLGFLDVSTPKYLLAGTLLGLWIATLAAAAWGGSSIAGRLYKTRFLRHGNRLWFVVRLLVDVVVALLALGTLLVLALFLGILEGPILELFPALVSIGLVFTFEPFHIRARPRGVKDHRRTAATRVAARGGLPRIIVVALWALVLVPLFSYQVLPQTSAEFGGARAREAYFDLRISEYSEESLWILVAPGDYHNETAEWGFGPGCPGDPNPEVDPDLLTRRPWPVMRSIRLQVLFEDSDSFLVRRPCPGPLDGHYDLQKSAVAAVIWVLPGQTGFIPHIPL